MWIDFEAGTLHPRDPVMVVAVSTSLPQYKALYSQAREMAEYMLRKMEFEKLGTVRTSAFPPEVLIREDGVGTLPECSFYLARGKQDVILFAGDTSPMDEQYEFSRFLLDRSRDFGVKDVYSVGARWAENPAAPEAEPQATGFSTDSTGVSRLRKSGVRVLGEEPAPFFSSLVVALAKDYDMRGYRVSVDHGEPSPHTRSVIRLLEILGEMIGFEVDLAELKSKALPVAPPRKSGSNAIYH
jgi:proteasome assembly chaperone (PAC2) family protein